MTDVPAPSPAPTPAPARQHIVVSAIGADRPGLVHDLTRAVAECGGSVAESRMITLGSEFAMLLLISGSWHALVRIESELKRVGEDKGLTVHLRRTEARQPRREMMPYTIDVVSVDQPGIVAGLSGFCTGRGIDIGEVSSRCYTAANTGAAMFAVQMGINVPSRLNVSQLREDFMEYCDSMNLDAILEPVKS